MASRFAIILLASAAAFPAMAQTETPGPAGTPSVTVLGSQEVQGILGREVRSRADENMGRIVDVLVDGGGRTRAAIIDFGGFLGVGSRKIAVEWKALHFVPAAEKRYSEARARGQGRQADHRARRIRQPRTAAVVGSR
jgi:hypothetical protein